VGTPLGPAVDTVMITVDSPHEESCSGAGIDVGGAQHPPRLVPTTVAATLIPIGVKRWVAESPSQTGGPPGGRWRRGCGATNMQECAIFMPGASLSGRQCLSPRLSRRQTVRGPLWGPGPQVAAASPGGRQPASHPGERPPGWGPLARLCPLPVMMKPIAIATLYHAVHDTTISPPTGAAGWRGRCAGFRKLRPPGSAAGCSRWSGPPVVLGPSAPSGLGALLSPAAGR
jgi:hypothetical protein